MAKVRQYHDLGFRFVKLYWRLREPEFTAAIGQALELGMIPFAHIDFNVFSISRALDLGLRDVEHAYTLIKNVMSPEEQESVWRAEIKPLAGGSRKALFFAQTLGYFAHLGPGDPGKAALSELLLLHRAGIPMAGVLRIGTWNTARTLGLQDSVGAVAPGMKADLVLFDRDPLADPGNHLGPKTVIKDGAVYEGADPR